VEDNHARARQNSASLSSAKQRQILDGARQVFLEVGFERACMDQVAARAEVSKATIYNHLHDKKELFLAALREHTREKRDALAALLGSPSGNVERDLQRFGETLLSFLVTRDALALRRIILADVQRFPELGQALYDEGPLAMRHRLATYFQEQVLAGALQLDDAELAAHQFILLCQGRRLSSIEYGILRDPPEERIRAVVRAAVNTFLRAYGAQRR
jgi:AcrR family transcriptional regulator